MPCSHHPGCPALLIVLLAAPCAQAGQVLQLLELQPGMPRTAAAQRLSAQFPPAAQLQARLPPGQHADAVQAFDPQGCAGQALCTASWSARDAQQVLHHEAVQLAIRQEVVMGLRHQRWQLAGEQCASALQQLRAGWQASWGTPQHEQSVQYRRGQYLQQAWGECPAAGLDAPPEHGRCLRAESGCDAAGRLESEVSLTDYARLRP